MQQDVKCEMWRLSLSTLHIWDSRIKNENENGTESWECFLPLLTLTSYYYYYYADDDDDDVDDMKNRESIFLFFSFLSSLLQQKKWYTLLNFNGFSILHPTHWLTGSASQLYILRSTQKI